MNQTEKENNLVAVWKDSPQKFLDDHWPDIYLWDKLNEIIQAIKENRRVVVPSGHGIGKTWLMSRIVLWFLFSHYPAKVITTAPTWNQVEKLLWSEIGTAYKASSLPLGGTLLLTSLKIRDEWFAIGFSTSPDVKEKEFGASSFQGFHSPNLLVVLDEAAGVEHAIWMAADSLITGGNNKIVAIGNPTSPEGDFYNACKSPLWTKVRVSSMDHPNVRTGQIIVPGAVTREWVDERRKEWGEDSALWQAKVLGQFPAIGTETLIPLLWIEQCINLNVSEEGDKRLGIDVALKGDDKTVYVIIYGQKVKLIEEEKESDPNGIIGKAISFNTVHQFDKIGVDDTVSIGGIVAGLEDAELDVDGMGFGNAAIESDRFENLRAEIWWNLREAFRNKEISIPNDPVLINQLSTPKYKFTRKGRILMESKDDMKKRGLKSPDRGDALAIAYSAGRLKDEPTMEVISTGGDE